MRVKSSGNRGTLRRRCQAVEGMSKAAARRPLAFLRQRNFEAHRSSALLHHGARPVPQRCSPDSRPGRHQASTETLRIRAGQVGRLGGLASQNVMRFPSHPHAVEVFYSLLALVELTN
jgi:hypothetical protein